MGWEEDLSEIGVGDRMERDELGGDGEGVHLKEARRGKGRKEEGRSASNSISGTRGKGA